MSIRTRNVNIPEDGLFLQELVDVFGVVQSCVEVEDYLRDYAELLRHLVAKLAAQSLDIVVQDLHHLLRLVGREYAHVGLGKREVGTYPDLTHRHHRSSEHGHPLAAYDLAEILLSSLATLSCLVLAGFSMLEDIDYEVVLLAFLGEDVLPVHDVFPGDLVGDVGHLVLVDAHAVALNHLPGLSL